MKKRIAKALALCMTVVLSLSNTSPIMAAILRSDLSDIMESRIVKTAPSNRSTSSDSGSSDPAATDSDISDEESVLPESATLANALLRMEASVTIKNESDLAALFPDANFRSVVFKAVKDGNENAVGTDIIDALANYRGSIKANAKGITDASGLQLLRKAELVDLSKNEIRDWTTLANSDKDWYGYQDDDGNWVNVEWKLTGNPFEKLPDDFGGKLVIQQPGTGSYTYSDPVEYTFVREGNDSCEATLNIQKCTIIGEGSERPAKLVSVAAIKGAWAAPLMKVDKIDNTTAKLSNIVKSGTQMIGIGIDQELHYQTSDEFGTITPGSQSSKYYMNAKVALFDRITVNSHPYKGSVTLIKTAKSNPSIRVPGAVYGLYQNGLKLEEYTTDRQGQITVMGLETGNYYFQELTAPIGYLVNGEKVEFEIAEHKTTISGGKASVALPDGTTMDAGDNEVFIAGPTSYGNSDDIVLTRKVNDDSKVKVTITYSSIGAAPEYAGAPSTPGEKLVKTFYDVKEAQDNINDMKNQNKITGPVTVDVEYINTASGAIKLSAADEEDPSVVKAPDTIVVSGTKTWVDESGYTGFHPDIVIHLYQNGKEYSTITLHDGQETFSFHDLPKFDAQNKEYKYTVSESFADKNETPNFTVKQDGNNFTNTFSRSVTEIEGLKGWDDGEENGLKHPTVTIRLRRNGQIYKTCNILPNQNSYSFKDLPIRDGKGKEYIYTVEEVPLDNYKSQLQPNKRDFLNTYTPNHKGEEPGGSGGGGGGNNPAGDTPPVPNGPGVQPPDEPSQPSDQLVPPAPLTPEAPVISEEYSTMGQLPKTGDKGACLSLLLCLGSGAAMALFAIRWKRVRKRSL